MMESSTAHNSKEFFIDGEMFIVRPLEQTDIFSEKTCQQLLNQNQLVAFGQIPEPDAKLLNYLADSDESYIFVALSEENKETRTEPAGIAIYTRNRTTGAHEMTVLAAEQYIDTRLIYELADSLIKDAYDHGVVALYTTGNSDDTHLIRLAKTLGMTLRLVPGNSMLVKYTLQVDTHPAVFDKLG